MSRKCIIVIIIMLLSGCDRLNDSLPVEIIKTEADIEEAEALLYKAWKPAHDMTVDGITIPRCQVKDFGEFLTMYDFSYVDEALVEDIYFLSLASYDEKGVMKLDDEGYIIFDVYEYNMYTPTIYDDRVRIADAYYEERIYKDDFSHRNGIFLIIKEESFGEEDELLGYTRTNYFEKDDNGKWRLTSFGGVGSQTPSGP